MISSINYKLCNYPGHKLAIFPILMLKLKFEFQCNFRTVHHIIFPFKIYITIKRNISFQYASHNRTCIILFLFYPDNFDIFYLIQFCIVNICLKRFIQFLTFHVHNRIVNFIIQVIPKFVFYDCSDQISIIFHVYQSPCFKKYLIASQ